MPAILPLQLRQVPDASAHSSHQAYFIHPHFIFLDFTGLTETKQLQQYAQRG